MVSSFGVDHIRHRQACAPVSISDLSSPKGQKLFWTWLQSKYVVGIFLAPPCGTASRARQIPLKRTHQQAFGPSPLRTDASPNGVQGLSWVNKLKVSLANKLYHFTAQVVQWAIDRDIPVCVENPQHSLFWATSFWQTVAGAMRYTVLHTCMFGSPRQKKTMLAHNAPEFNSLAITCMGQSSSHTHLPWGITPRGFATAEETAYPMPLARAIANCFVLIACNRGIQPLPSTLQDVQPLSLDALRAMRAQAGQQPRATKIPPIVPTYATKIHVSGLPDDLPHAVLFHSLAHPLTLRNPIGTLVLPKGAKLSSVQPKSIFKGGEVFADCRCVPMIAREAQLDNSPVVQTWGIPWTEAQFVEQAAKHGHPAKLDAMLPSALRQAIVRFQQSTPGQRCTARAKKLSFWCSRARELVQPEREFKEAMPPSVKKVLAGKRILLWKEMLESVDYPDMGVVNEFAAGSMLTGETETTGLWPAKFVPAQMTESDLFELSARDRPALSSKSLAGMDDEVALTVWEQTLQEVDDGVLEGPMPLHTVPDHLPLSRRFGVKQGSKIRNIDDFSQSGVNGCAQTTESPKPHNLDVVSSLCLALMNSKVASSSPEWKCRSFDLKGAYRQCAVHPSASRFAHIVVRNPGDDTLSAFRMNALPFGSVRSVHSFLRVAHSIWYLGVELFDILWCGYFDDFMAFGLSEECSSVTDTIHMLFDLIGWKFARSGDKASPFSSTMKALGVMIDVSNMSSGLVLFDNTPMRKSDLIESLDKVIKKGSLPRHEALRLRGRLQFASGQIFGRTARSCLAVLTSHAYSPVSSKLSNSALSALETHRRLLNSNIPRKISARASRTWFVFTDASYETTDGVPHSGLGAVLCDEQGRVCRFMSERVPSDCLMFLNPAKKKTIIFECEYVAVWCAFHLWKQFIAGQHIILFIDNNAVRDSLISCQHRARRNVTDLRFRA